MNGVFGVKKSPRQRTSARSVSRDGLGSGFHIQNSRKRLKKLTEDGRERSLKYSRRIIMSGKISKRDSELIEHEYNEGRLEGDRKWTEAINERIAELEKQV
jgi:hypothetical protein